MRTLYRFVGGPHNGTVGVADQEPVGDVSVQGRRLVDDRGHTVGRVVEDWEHLPPALAGRGRRGGASMEELDLAPAAEPEPQQLTFPDAKAWRRHVRAWAIERDLLTANHRGTPSRLATEAWVKAHGEPVYTS